MTTVQVVRLRPNDKWTHGLLNRILDRSLYPVPGVEYELLDESDRARRGEPAIVVLPGEEWAGKLKSLNRYLSRFPRVLVIVVADEGSLFPHREIAHPDMRLWVQTPRPGVHGPGEAYYLGFGWRYDTPDVLGSFRRPRDHSYFFAGQVTHRRRYELVTALEGLDDPAGVLIQTQSFSAGLPRDSYLEEVVRARWIPCPSGPLCPDSFRLYEALEGGAVPIVDAECPGYPDEVTGRDYWRLVYGDDGDRMLRPLSDWRQLPGPISPEWPATVGAWWQSVKRDIAWQLRHDALRTDPAELVPGVTVVISTSPIPSCPSTYHLDRTLDSIRERLPDAEVIVTADGWRPGAPCSREAYVEYLDEIVWRSRHEWRGVLPVLSPEWIHQANTTRRALDLVRTTAVLFSEHDTPLVGPDCPWDRMVDVLATGEAHVIRLSSEATILEPWRHLYLDETPVELAGVPLLRTVQWSSRPHLADTAWYRELLSAYFGDDSRTFTEDVLHRVIQWSYNHHGPESWDRWRLWTYAPEGDIKRSTHTDGRDGSSKGRLTFAYPAGGRPPGAPRPSREEA